MSKNGKTILVVDDDLKITKALTLRLNSAGYETVTAFNGADGFILAQLKNPDLIITDIWMPEGSGPSLAYRVKQSMPKTPLIFLTASKQPGLKEKVQELGGAGYLEKPYEPDSLLEMVSELLKTSAQTNILEESKLKEIMAHS